MLKQYGRYARSTKVMVEEEGEGLMDTVSRMVEVQSVSRRMESMEMCKEDVINEVYLEYKYMEWLKSELRDIGIDVRNITSVEEDAKIMEESVVGLESQCVYLNHHGRVHTPLPGPAIITEKGVEQGQVIGLYCTGELNGRRAGNIELDWSGVGGMEKTVPGVEDLIKYVAEVVEMPRWSPMNYKPSSSKWCDPSDMIYGKYEIYDPYMGKGDG